jgi:DNA invertase Pin-like site-specific DNA recombinase
VSTEEQAVQGVSLDAQIERVRAYATAQALRLEMIYRDEGVSAGTPLASRPEGSRMVEALHHGEFAHVIAVKLDRTFRNAADCMHTVDGWTKSGISVHFVDLGGQAVDSQTAMGKFFLSIMASCAELELGNIRDRTRAALQHKRMRGDRLGTTPYGFRTPAPGAPLTPDPQELATVRRLLELCAQEIPFTNVARQLTMEGHVAKRGGSWHSATVRRVWLSRCRFSDLLTAGVRTGADCTETPEENCTRSPGDNLHGEGVRDAPL